jgi:hypothetical protein
MIVLVALSLLGVWVWFFWLYRDYRIDAYRQRLFALRNQLWDYAAAGNISFDHPAYLIVRSRMNGLIRFAHLLSFIWVLTGLAMRRVRPFPELEAEATLHLDQALETLEPATADKLRAFHQDALFRAAEHVILLSPIFWLLVAPVVLVGLVRLALVQASQLLTRFPGTDLVDSEAARLGSLA